MKPFFAAFEGVFGSSGEEADALNTGGLYNSCFNLNHDMNRIDMNGIDMIVPFMIRIG